MSQSTRTSPFVRTKTSQRQLDDDDAEKLRALGDAVERAFTKVSSARDRLNARRKAKSMPNTPMTRASEDVVDDFMLERQGRFEQLEAAATRLDFLNIIQEDDDQKNVELAQNTITVEYNDVRQSHDFSVDENFEEGLERFDNFVCNQPRVAPHLGKSGHDELVRESSQTTVFTTSTLVQ